MRCTQDPECTQHFHVLCGERAMADGAGFCLRVVPLEDRDDVEFVAACAQHSCSVAPQAPADSESGSVAPAKAPSVTVPVSTRKKLKVTLSDTSVPAQGLLGATWDGVAS